MVADRYNLNKLVDRETRKEYQIDVANRFSALEGFEISSVDGTWVKIRDSIKASAKENVGFLGTNRNKPWFDEECSELANITAEPDIPKPSLIEVELPIEKLKRHKTTGVDNIPSELIQTGGGKLYEEIHKLILLIWNKKELPKEWKESIIVPKKGDRMDCNNYRGISILSTSYKILSNILLSRMTICT